MNQGEFDKNQEPIKQRGSKSAAKAAPKPLNDGLCSMPIEAVDVESEWQVAQDHIEDGNTDEALRWLEMTITKINILRTKLIKDSFAV